VCNVHPCPLPGGRVAFVSNRDGFKAPRGAQESLQLFVMDDDGTNVEKIGYLNVAQALHRVILKDGRIIFSSLEMQGSHNVGWGILGIHPDGTAWNPGVSALGWGADPVPLPDAAFGRQHAKVKRASVSNGMRSVRSSSAPNWFHAALADASIHTFPDRRPELDLGGRRRRDASAFQGLRDRNHRQRSRLY